jgi:hypothetical protein
LLNNSKSKRPISNQIYDISPNASSNNIANNNNNNISQQQATPNRVGSPTTVVLSPSENGKSKSLDDGKKSNTSSSNENLADTSDDELNENSKLASSNPSSREKTPDSQHEDLNQPQNGKTLFNSNKTYAPIAPSTPSSKAQEEKLNKSPLDDKASKNKKDSIPNENNNNAQTALAAAPVPAPRSKSKPFSGVKSFFSGLASSNKDAGAAKPLISQPVAATTSTPEIKSNGASSLSPKESRKSISNEENALAAEKVVEEVPPQLQHLNKDRPKRANVKRPSTKNPQSKIEQELAAEDLSFASSSAPKSKLPGLVETNDEEKAAQAKPTPDLASKEAVVSTTVESKPKISPPSLTKAAAPVEQPKISLNILENVKLRKTVRVKSPIPGSSEETSSTPAPTNEPKVTATSVPGALSAPIAPANNTTPVTTNSSAPNKLGNRFSMFEQSSNMTTPLFAGLKPTPFKKAAELNSNTNSSDLSELKEEEGSGASESASATATPTNSTTVVGSSQSVPTTKPNKPLPPVPPFKPPRPPFNPSTGKSSSLSDQPPLQTQQLFAKLRPVSVMGSASESSSVCSSGANTNNDSTTNTSLAKTNLNTNNIKNISPTKLTNPILNENENLAGVGGSSSSSTTPTPAESNGKSSSSSSSELKINTDKEKRTSVRDIVQMLSEESKVRTV